MVRLNIELCYPGKGERVTHDGERTPFLQRVETHGISANGDVNRLIHGENLSTLNALRGTLKGKVALIYIDPPFATNRAFRNSDHDLVYADYRMGPAYLEFLRKRFLIFHEILSEDGSLYAHLSPRVAGYAKVLLDEIFGFQPFHREIIWKRSTSHPNAKSFAVVHDTILFYPKTKNYYFKPERFHPRPEDRFPFTDKMGRRFATCDLTGASLKTAHLDRYHYLWRGHHRIWRCPKETMARLEKENRLYYTRTGLPRKKLYLDEAKGSAPSDLWCDISPLRGQSPERVSFPTQKPERLLARVIAASSAEGDLVLDAFCGSGTTLAVAEKLNRAWIGMDESPIAIETTKRRLLSLKAGIGQKGTPLQTRHFEIYRH